MFTFWNSALKLFIENVLQTESLGLESSHDAFTPQFIFDSVQVVRVGIAISVGKNGIKMFIKR